MLCWRFPSDFTRYRSTEEFAWIVAFHVDSESFVVGRTARVHQQNQVGRR